MVGLFCFIATCIFIRNSILNYSYFFALFVQLINTTIYESWNPSGNISQ